MTYFRLTKLTLASVVGAALLAGPAMAQTAADKPANKPPAAQAATSSKPETVEPKNDRRNSRAAKMANAASWWFDWPSRFTNAR